MEELNVDGRITKRLGVDYTGSGKGSTPEFCEQGNGHAGSIR